MIEQMESYIEDIHLYNYVACTRFIGITLSVGSARLGSALFETFFSVHTISQVAVFAFVVNARILRETKVAVVCGVGSIYTRGTSFSTRSFHISFLYLSFPLFSSGWPINCLLCGDR